MPDNTMPVADDMSAPPAATDGDWWSEMFDNLQRASDEALEIFW